METERVAQIAKLDTAEPKQQDCPGEGAGASQRSNVREIKVVRRKQPIQDRAKVTSEAIQIGRAHV